MDKTCTPAYRAPELIDMRALLMLPEEERVVGPAVDVWAIGVTLFRLAFGKCPFDDAAGNTQRLGILNGKYSIPASSPYSEGLHRLIASCLTLQASKRPTVQQIMQQASTLPTWPGAGAARMRSVPSFRAPSARFAASIPSPVRGVAPDAAVLPAGAASPGHRSVRSSSLTGGRTPVPPSKPRVSKDAPTAPPAPPQLLLFATGADSGSSGLFDADGDGDTNLEALDSTAPAFMSQRPAGLNPSHLSGPAARAPARTQPSAPSRRELAPHARVASAPPLQPPPQPAARNGEMDAFDMFREAAEGMQREGRTAAHAHDDDGDLNEGGPSAGTTATSGALALGRGVASAASSLFTGISRGVRPATTLAQRMGSALVGMTALPSASLMREALQTRVMQVMGGDARKHRCVIKATSLLPGPPKGKYVRRLVLDAWDNRSGGATVTYLPRRPVTTEPVVALKACVLLLKLWQQGPHAALSASQALLSTLEAIIGAWAGHEGGGDVSPRVLVGVPGARALVVAIHAYASYVAAKLAFHASHAAFDAHFCMDRIAAAVSAAVENEMRVSVRDLGSPGEQRRLASRSPSVLAAFAAVPGMAGPRSISNLPVRDALSTITETVNLLDMVVHLALDMTRSDALSEYVRQAQAMRPGALSTAAGVDVVAATLAGSLPPLVSDAWELYLVSVSMLLATRRRIPADAVAAADVEQLAVWRNLCTRVDATLPACREFFEHTDTLYHRSTLASCVTALDRMPVLPTSSPFTDSHSEGEFLASLQVNILSSPPAGGTPTPVRSTLLRRAPTLSPDAAAAVYGWPSDKPYPLPSDLCVDPPAALDPSHAAAMIPAVPGNSRCAECGDKDPTWMSINLGVLFCLRCSGLHRQLGVHISQVRSLQLDTMRVEWAKRVLAVGNSRGNAYYEARLTAGVRPAVDDTPARKPRPVSSMDDVLRWCRDKYVRRAFAAPGLSPAEILDAGGPSCVQTVMTAAPVLSSGSARAAPVALPADATMDFDSVFGPVSAAVGGDDFDPFSGAAAIAGSTQLESLSTPSSPALPPARAASVHTIMNPEDDDESDEDTSDADARRIAELTRSRIGASVALSPSVAPVDADVWAFGPTAPSAAASSDFDFAPAAGSASAFAASDDGWGTQDVVTFAPAPAVTAAPIVHLPASVVIDATQLSLEKQVYSDGVVDVYDGEFRGMHVAVTQYSGTPLEGPNAADVTAHLARVCALRHVHLLPYVGVTTKPFRTVAPLASRGCLADILRDADTNLPWRTALSIARDAARGLAYLHESSPQVLHGDLTSESVHLDERWAARIAGFGMLRIRSAAAGAHAGATAAHTPWMAPEVIAGFPVTDKADVYAFGVLLWELLTRSPPYAGMEPMQVGLAVLNRGLRPSIPPTCPEYYASLMRQCWTSVPEDRPPFSHVCALLTHALTQATAAGGHPT